MRFKTYISLTSGGYCTPSLRITLRHSRISISPYTIYLLSSLQVFPSPWMKISNLGSQRPRSLLDNDTISDLQMPISEDEVTEAIAATPNGKSPGPGGFTTKFYNFFAPLLTPFLTKVFNSLQEGSMFPP